MSHSVTMFNQFSLKNLLFILVNYSSKTNSKVRIRKNEILTKSIDSSGYHLNENSRLTFMHSHTNQNAISQQKNFVKDYLQDLKYIQAKANLRVKEIQKIRQTKKSRILTKKVMVMTK